MNRRCCALERGTKEGKKADRSVPSVVIYRVSEAYKGRSENLNCMKTMSPSMVFNCCLRKKSTRPTMYIERDFLLEICDVTLRKT